MIDAMDAGVSLDAVDNWFALTAGGSVANLRWSLGSVGPAVGWATD
jgi:hypothetical protein